MGPKGWRGGARRGPRQAMEVATTRSRESRAPQTSGLGRLPCPLGRQSGEDVEIELFEVRSHGGAADAELHDRVRALGDGRPGGTAGRGGWRQAILFRPNLAQGTTSSPV